MIGQVCSDLIMVYENDLMRLKLIRLFCTVKTIHVPSSKVNHKSDQLQLDQSAKFNARITARMPCKHVFTLYIMKRDKYLFRRLLLVIRNKKERADLLYA